LLSVGHWNFPPPLDETLGLVMPGWWPRFGPWADTFWAPTPAWWPSPYAKHVLLCVNGSLMAAKVFRMIARWNYFKFLSSNTPKQKIIMVHRWQWYFCRTILFQHWHFVEEKKNYILKTDKKFFKKKFAKQVFQCSMNIEK